MKMQLADLVQQTNWAIVPAKLDAINQVLYNHAHGINVDLKTIAENGKQLENSYNATVTEDGLAIIPIHGVIGKRMNLFMQISGGVSSELVKRDFLLALADADVKAILLDIDSAGGTVDGTKALADLIYESRGQKPVIAFANGIMCSGAYWIGSAADKIIIEATGEMGSIGVIMCHYDYSKADEQAGVKRTYIYSGKYKAAGNSAQPLPREAQDYLQESTDYIYSLFVDAVARNRGVSAETVLSDMADGKILIGQQAVDAGLADELGSFESAVITAINLAENDSSTTYQYFKEENTMLKKETIKQTGDVTLKELEVAYPDLIKEAREEGTSNLDTAKISAEAVKAEKERILGLNAVHFGEEASAKFKAIVESGITVEQFKAVREAAPAAKGADKQAEMLDAIKKAGAANPGAGDAVDVSQGKDFMSLVDAHMAINKCKKSDAMKAVAGKHPQEHEAWIMSQQGTVTVH